jgi:hypothetical protein
MMWDWQIVAVWLGLIAATALMIIGAVDVVSWVL